MPAPRRPLSWNLLAEERIRDAQEAGEFENLPGFGRPIPGIDEPHDDLWWVKDKLKREQIAALPPALAIRLDVEKTLARLAELLTEAAVRREIAALNERLRKASFAAAWGPSVDCMELDVDECILNWRQLRNDSAGDSSRSHH